MEVWVCPIEGFQLFKPWVVTFQLSALQLRKLGYQEKLGIDWYFLERAKADKKKIIELENLEDQLQAMAGLNKYAQLVLLQQALDLFGDEGKRSLDILYNAWSDGDKETLSSLFIDSMRDTTGGEEVYQHILVNRNKTMTDKISSLMEDKKMLFVVVGLGHLIGEDSINQLLVDKGYQVIQR